MEPPPLPHERAAFLPEDARRSARDLERFVGLSVLGRVGIGAVLLAAAYFGQLGWTHLGPGARAALVYTGGILFVALGAWLRRRVRPRYVAMLWGGGVALTYLAGVLAHLRFLVIGSGLATVSLLASAALGQFLARVLGLQTLATVALTGAYAAPVLVGSPSPTPTAFFALLVTLHTWAAWTEHRWQWFVARGVAAALTAALVIGWYVEHGIVGPWSFTWHVEAVWLCLVGPEVLTGWQRRPVAVLRCVLVGALTLLALLALLVAISSARTGAGEHHGTLVALAAAKLVFAAWLVPRARELGGWLARAAALALPLVVAFGWPVAGDWLRERALLPSSMLALGSALLVTRRWTTVGDLGAALAALLALALHAHGFEDVAGRKQTVVIVAAFSWLTTVGRWSVGRVFGLVGGAFAAWACLVPAGIHPLPGDGMAFGLAGASLVATYGAFVAAKASDRTLAWAAAIVQAMLLWFWLHSAWQGALSGAGAAATAVWNVRTGAIAAVVVMTVVARQRLSPSEVAPRAVLGATALAGVYVGGLLELLDAVAELRFGPRAVASSIYTLAFAGALLGAGFWRRQPALRWVALAAFGVVVVKILAHDLSEVDTPVRVLATGVLGGVLLLAAWAYARYQRASATGERQ